VDVDVVEVASGVWHARGKHVGWVLVTEGDSVTLVDTGYPGDRARVLASLEWIGRRPADVAAVLLTHAHPDHLGSAEFFRSSVSTPVLVHEDEVANATGERVEQVSTATLVKRAWRPSVVLWSRDAIALGPNASSGCPRSTRSPTRSSTYPDSRVRCSRPATRLGTVPFTCRSAEWCWPVTR